MSAQGYAGINSPVCQYNEIVYLMPSLSLSGVTPKAYQPGWPAVANFSFELLAGAGFRKHQIFAAIDMTRELGYMGYHWDGSAYDAWKGWIYPWLKAKMNFYRGGSKCGETAITLESPTQGWEQPLAGQSVASEFLGAEFAGAGNMNGKGGGMSLALNGGLNFSIPMVQKNGLIDRIVVEGQIGYVSPQWPDSLNYYQEQNTAPKTFFVGIISK